MCSAALDWREEEIFEDIWVFINTRTKVHVKFHPIVCIKEPNLYSREFCGIIISKLSSLVEKNNSEYNLFILSVRMKVLWSSFGQMLFPTFQWLNIVIHTFLITSFLAMINRRVQFKSETRTVTSVVEKTALFCL